LVDKDLHNRNGDSTIMDDEHTLRLEERATLLIAESQSQRAQLRHNMESARVIVQEVCTMKANFDDLKADFASSLTTAYGLKHDMHLLIVTYRPDLLNKEIADQHNQEVVTYNSQSPIRSG